MGHMALNPLKLFTSLGLSATESKVYLANLKLGPTSVQEIAKQAKMSRTTAYDAIASLQDQGLIATFERGKKKFYAAEDPESVKSHFKKQIAEMENNFDTLSRSMNELKMMAGGERPAVRFYEGNDAIYAMFNDVAKVAPKLVLEVTNVDDVYHHLDNKVLLDARKALSVATKFKMLHRGELRNPREGSEYCELPEKYGDFHGDIWIYGNRIAFVTFIGKMMTVIIENEQFAQMATMMFDGLWGHCQLEQK